MNSPERNSTALQERLRAEASPLADGKETRANEPCAPDYVERQESCCIAINHLIEWEYFDRQNNVGMSATGNRTFSVRVGNREPHRREQLKMKQQRERSVELVLDGGGPFTIWRDEDADGLRRGLFVDAMICDNPDCDCRDIWLSATLIDDRFKNINFTGDRLSYRFVPRGGESAPPLKHLSARLDVDTGKVELSDRAPLERRDPELLAWLQEGMSEHYLARLRKRWRYVKGINKEAWRGRDWSWWKPGALVSWLEVNPDGFNLLFKLNGDAYWADDMYCINPGCSCNEVGLAFSRLSEAGIEHVGAVSVRIPSCRFSHIMDDGSDEKTLKRLWTAFHQAGLCDALKHRIKEMRIVGQEIVRLSTWKDTSKPLPGPPRSKVGRNDPCPCGSGKKFKKCCLGKS